MRARCSTQLGWSVAAAAALLVGCSGAQDPGSVARMGATLAVTPGVPDDFPRMLGCGADELGNPDDPALRDQLKKLCDVAQVGLYALAQDTGLTEDERRTHALMIMGGTLERMTQLIVQASPPDSPDPTDAGVVP